MPDPTTQIAYVSVDRIELRGHDLINELLGQYTYTEITFFLLRHRFPSPQETRALDACLVTLVEHGLTPSALITRLAINSVPTEIQVAMAAGLSTVGNVFAGTMEGCARLLQEGIDSGESSADYCSRIVCEYRAHKRPIPGFGHAIHKPDDPRTDRLLVIARECGVAGKYVDLLLELSAEIDRASAKHLTINATGMIGAILLEMGFEPDIMRGFAVISRAAGLLAHIQEERSTDSVRTLRRVAKQHIPYVAPDAPDHAG